MSNKVKAAVLGALLVLTACAQDGVSNNGQPVRVEEVVKARTLIIDTACDWVRPIFISRSDALTIETARAILGHNETWEAQCKKQTNEKQPANPQK
jgi:hypothetical protein